jgi:MFS family permease
MSATRNDAVNTVARPEPSKGYRWLVLLFVSLPMFGNYYIYDSINPVTDLMKAQLHFTDQQIGRLNSIYSVAAVIVLLLGGIIVDRLGTKKSTFIFAFICLIASVITVATTNPNVILASRFVLGLGAEPLIVAVTTALAKWFRGKELSFAFGINLMLARLGSVAADNSPTWAKHLVSFDSWRGPLTLGIAFGVICVLAAIVYWAFESYAERNYHLGQAGEIDKLVWRDLFRFGTSYWFIVALCMTFYSAIYPFRTFAVKFFIEGHGTSREFGGFLNSVIPQAAIYATPLFGLLVDKFGKRALLMTVGSILLVPAFLLMLPGMHVPLYLPSILLGISFSLIPAVMWPSVAYIVDQNRLGTAYGLMTMIQQIGFFIMNETLGNLNDRYGASAANPGGYSPMIYLLSTLGILGVIFAYLLRRSESGPHAHGLETITTSSAPKSEAPA